MEFLKKVLLEKKNNSLKKNTILKEKPVYFIKNKVFMILCIIHKEKKCC